MLIAVEISQLSHLFRSELLRGGEILAVVVAQVIVAHDGRRFDSGRDEEIHENRLDLRLTRFEVVAPDVNAVFLSKFDDSRHKRVLRTSVDVTNLPGKSESEYTNERMSQAQKRLASCGLLLSLPLDKCDELCAPLQECWRQRTQWTRTLLRRCS